MEITLLLVTIAGFVWLANKLNTIMATQEDLAIALETTNTQLQKAITEIVAAIQSSGNTTPRVDAAVAALQAAAQALDDLNPDLA